MSRLLLVRHGETELKSSERYWGRTDTKLSALGLRQAERLRDRLAAERIDAIYSSNLKRARMTAEIIASGHQLDVTTCAELREVDFGEIEGLNMEEVSQLFPELAVRMKKVDRGPDFRYPGGESLDELGNRLSSFLGRLKKHNEEETVLVVAHYGVIRTLICQLMGMELRHVYHIRLKLASLSIMETGPTGAILHRLNDTSHLDSI